MADSPLVKEKQPENNQEQNNLTPESANDNVTVVAQKRKSEKQEPDPSTGRKTRQKITPDSFRKIDDLSTVEYYFENGLRKIQPYYFEYKAYAKGRWFDRELLEVLSTEFQDRDADYYRQAIESGLVTLNEKKVEPNTIVRNGDLLGHKIHRHEPDVTDKPIEIVHEEDELYVINKPGGIPIHPAGRYRHNTVIHVLRKQLNVPRLFPANRLDRPTSGLMLIARTPERARILEKEMTQGMIRKTYLCRVEGEFPEGEIVCEQPIKTISHKLSLNYVHADGKYCKTIFERLSFNGKTSVVQCRPMTGRTHQIRVHLRYLGYPISNDIMYGSHTPWSHLMKKEEALNDEEAQQLIDAVLESSAARIRIVETETGGTALKRCQECNVVLLPEPKPDDLVIWLHAWKYAANGWAYETEIPPWAREDFEA